MWCAVLIHNAELDFGARVADVRVYLGRVTDLATGLRARAGEPEIDARGRALLPTFHDAHFHLYAMAAARASVDCTPAALGDAVGLRAALCAADTRLSPGEWLRGIGFHESLFAGSGAELDRNWLDGALSTRPVRIQHRSGRLWVFNGAAFERLGVVDAAEDDPCERIDGHLTGRVYDGDAWLRQRLQEQRPALAALSRELWLMGVTSLTDAGVTNGSDDYAALARAQVSGELWQDVEVMGGDELDSVAPCVNDGRRLFCGPRKFHLHEQALPDFDGLCASIRQAHAARRSAAFHCVTRVELVFALAALRVAGVRCGDRIEHAAVAPPECVAQIAELNLGVATQPAFIAVRGDDYLRDVAREDQPWLYRTRTFLDAGVPLALSSDAPYGPVDPWRIVAASVDRRTPAGRVLGAREALSPEQAVAALCQRCGALGMAPRRVAPGCKTGLMLLPLAWRDIRQSLARLRPVQVWGVGAAVSCAAGGDV